MIDRSNFTMSKTALTILFLLLGISFSTGNKARECPKYPLASTNSISGMVVGSIVTTEKITAGVISYFYFLTENTVNQLVSMSNKAEQFLSMKSSKVSKLFGGFVTGTITQVKAIYGMSSGSVRGILDQFIMIENSIQKMVFGHLLRLSNTVTSGNFTSMVTRAIKNPVKSIETALDGVSKWLHQNLGSIMNGVSGIFAEIKNGDFSLHFGGVLTAPIDAVKQFIKQSSTILKTTHQNASMKIHGFITILAHGSLTEIVTSILASPVGIFEEVWSCSVKITNSLKEATSLGLKNTIQPFLGADFTHLVGKITSFPLDLTAGIWNSYKTVFNQVRGFFASITGGGSLSAQINAVITNPLPAISATFNATMGEIKGLSKGLLGEALSEQLSDLLSSPKKLISGALSPILGMGGLTTQIKTLISSPITITTQIWMKIKQTTGGIFKGVLGGKLTHSLGQLVSSPITDLNAFLSMITGGGSIGSQIKTLLTNPLSMINTIVNRTKALIGGYITAIDGGGSFSVQIKTLLSHPLGTLMNALKVTVHTIQDSSKVILGGNITQGITNVVFSPLSSVQHLLGSVTGGGSFGQQISSLLKSPIIVLKNSYQTAKNYTKDITHLLLGGTITRELSSLIGSPLSVITKSLSTITGGGSFGINVHTLTHPISTLKKFVSEYSQVFSGSLRLIFGRNLVNNVEHTILSPVSSISHIFGSVLSPIKGLLGGGVHISGSVNAGGSAEGSQTSGIINKIGALIKEPGKIAQKSFNGAAGLFKSFAGSLQGLISHIPIIGGSVKGKISFGGGGGGGGGAEGGSKASGEAGGSSSGSGNKKGRGSSAASGGGKGGSSGSSGGSGGVGFKGGLSFHGGGGSSGGGGASFHSGGSF